MTHYLHNGQLFEIDRMPPTDKSDNYATTAFNYYLSTLQPIPHAFSGESRVVPEDEIEWEYQIWDRRWQTCSQEDYEKETPNMRRRVATTINESPGYTSSSGEKSIISIAIKELEIEKGIDKGNVNVWYNKGLAKAILILESIQKASPPSPQTGEKESMYTSEVKERALSFVDAFCKPVYFQSEACHKAAFVGYATGYVTALKDQPPPAQSDQEAAENYADRFYKVHTYDHYESDYDYRTQCAKNRQVQEHFLAGCTQLCGQQQQQAGREDYWKGFDDALELVVDMYGSVIHHPFNIADCVKAKVNRLPTDQLRPAAPSSVSNPVGFAEWLEDNKYWRNHNGIWFQGSSHVGNSIADLYTLFPGSKSAPQVIVDAALEMEINDILNECNGTGAGAVSVFNHLRQHYHITPKPKQP